MPEPIAGSVSTEQVMTSFYGSDAQKILGQWAWVRETYNDKLIVDDDNGNLYELPWAEADGEQVEFGSPFKVKPQYVRLEDQKAASLPNGGGGLRNAIQRLAGTISGNTYSLTVPSHTNVTVTAPAAATVRPTPPGDRKDPDMPLTFDDEQAKALRARLGLADDANDEQILAALAAPPDPAPPVAASAPPVAPGVIQVDPSVMEQMQADAELGREAHAMLMAHRRDSVIEQAVKDRKFSLARSDHWKHSWDLDPEGTALQIASLQPGLVPGNPEGYAAGEKQAEDALYAQMFPEG